MRKRLYLCVAATALCLAFSPASEGAQPPRPPGKSVLPDAANTFGIFEFLERLFSWPGANDRPAPRDVSGGKGDTPRYDPDDPPPCPPEALPDDPCVRGHGPVG
ncbi:MAG: hypothetical protein JNK60_07875 [Acidobacteria bacterium]|nr:hypothetical protein [Acidobacteriota bacterium]